MKCFFYIIPGLFFSILVAAQSPALSYKAADGFRGDDYALSAYNQLNNTNLLNQQVSDQIYRGLYDSSFLLFDEYSKFNRTDFKPSTSSFLSLTLDQIINDFRVPQLASNCTFLLKKKCIQLSVYSIKEPIHSIFTTTSTTSNKWK